LSKFKTNPKKYVDDKSSSEIEKRQKQEEKSKMPKLRCVECGVKQELPTHCGKPMHKEGDQLVCWMGAECGAQPIPKHHDKPMEIIE
jgi:hypothetical protein